MTTTTKKNKFSSLTKGAVMSETQYYRVDKIQGNKVQLTNQNDEQIVVDADYVEQCLTSADYFTETKKVNKTEASNILINNPFKAITVSFNKQVKVGEVLDKIMKAYETSTFKTMSNSVSEALKLAFDGEERTIRGYHNGGVNEFGRVNMIDMDIEKDSTKSYDVRFRQVDPRTINFIIVDNIKYIIN